MYVARQKYELIVRCSIWNVSLLQHRHSEVTNSCSISVATRRSCEGSITQVSRTIPRSSNDHSLDPELLMWRREDRARVSLIDLSLFTVVSARMLPEISTDRVLAGNMYAFHCRVCHASCWCCSISRRSADSIWLGRPSCIPEMASSILYWNLSSITQENCLQT